MQPLGNHRRPFLLVQTLSRPAVKAVVNSLIGGEAEQVSLCSFVLVTIPNLRVVVKMMAMMMDFFAVKGVMVVIFFYRCVDVAP